MGYQYPLYVRKLSTSWSAKRAWCGLRDERRAGSPAEKWGQSASAIVVLDPAASQTRGTVGGRGPAAHPTRCGPVWSVIWPTDAVGMPFRNTSRPC